MQICSFLNVFITVNLFFYTDYLLLVDFSKKSFIFVEIFLVKTSLHIFKKGVTCATFRAMVDYN
jgi:hypothetical protein